MIFQLKIHVLAAILDLWVVLTKEFFTNFVDNAYAGKVTKVFLEILSGYGAAAKRSVCGVIFPLGHGRANNYLSVKQFVQNLQISDQLLFWV